VGFLWEADQQEPETLECGAEVERLSPTDMAAASRLTATCKPSLAALAAVTRSNRRPVDFLAEGAPIDYDRPILAEPHNTAQRKSLFRRLVP